MSLAIATSILAASSLNSESSTSASIDATTPMFRFPQLDCVENVEKYKPGGYHPVSLQDILGGKYKIIHKLGHGGFGTVWLGRDLVKDRNVAIKVLVANTTDHDLQFLTTLRDRGTHPNIVNLREVFTIEGLNGSHQCLVLDVAGPNLKQLIAGNIYLPGPVARRAGRKIAEVLMYLHSLGICHGDLTETNVLFELKGFATWTEAEVYANLGAPRSTPLLLRDGSVASHFAPKDVVQSIEYSQFDLELLTSNVRIIDFGEAFFVDNPPAQRLGTPAPFFAPEMLFGLSASTATDVWALGCLIFELHACRPLIFAFMGKVDEAMGEVVHTLGPFPEDWRVSYYDKGRADIYRNGEKDPWFDKKANLRHPLEALIDGIKPALTEQEKTAFTVLLKGALAYEPQIRLSAREIAIHPWFKT